MSIAENIQAQLRQCTSVIVVLNKAFDTVDHNVLADISTSEFIVSIKSYFSNTRNIIAEVPQSSVLCPLRFLVYINSLKKCVNLLKHNIIEISYNSIQLF